MTTLYRIIDDVENTIVANGLTYEQAASTVLLYTQDHPNGKFSIESYSVNHRKRIMGHDPDLYND